MCGDIEQREVGMGYSVVVEVVVEWVWWGKEMVI